MSNKNVFRMLLLTAMMAAVQTVAMAQKRPSEDKKPGDILQNVARNLEEKDRKLLARFGSTDTHIYFEYDDVAKSGITQQTCLDWEAVVEAKLKSAGFKIEPFVTPMFDIKLDVIKVSATELAYSIDMSLVQDMILERDKSVTLAVPTWRKSSLGRIAASETQKIRADILAMMDVFLADYRSANVKR